MRRLAKNATVVAAVMLVAAMVCVSALQGIASEAVPSQRRDESACVASHQKTASPNAVLLGEPVTITLSVRLACPHHNDPLHVVLVLDDSPSMAGARMNAALAASRDLIRWLDLTANPATRVGVVTYSAIARTRCQLTNDPVRATACVSEVRPNTAGTRIDVGLEEAMKVFRQGRVFVTDLDDLREAAILISDGEAVRRQSRLPIWPRVGASPSTR